MNTESLNPLIEAIICTTLVAQPVLAGDWTYVAQNTNNVSEVVNSLEQGRNINGLNLRLFGGVQSTYIVDSTQGLGGSQGNTLIQKRYLSGTHLDNFQGRNYGTAFDISGSVGFDMIFPTAPLGIVTEGVFTIGTTGQIGSTYLYVSKDDWSVLFGNYGSLLGWQPTYLPPEPILQPSVAVLDSIDIQARVTNTQELEGLENVVQMQTSFAVLPPVSNSSSFPRAEAGLRFSVNGYQTFSLAASSLEGQAVPRQMFTDMLGPSIGVSAALIPVRTATSGNATGGAIAEDIFIPLINSGSEKTRSDNLSFLGEASQGTGTGTSEFQGLTAGIPSSVKIGAATYQVPLGVAGVDQSGQVELIRFQTFRGSLQYTLPGGQWTLSGGYAQVNALNASHFSSNALVGTGTIADGIAPKIQYGFGAVTWDPWKYVRCAFEMSHTRDTYNDPDNRFADNQRYQISTYLLF